MHVKVRPDSNDLLFLRSSCTFIIKKSWEKPGKQKINFSKHFAFSCNIFPVFFLSNLIFVSLDPLKCVGKIWETSNQFSETMNNALLCPNTTNIKSWITLSRSFFSLSLLLPGYIFLQNYPPRIYFLTELCTHLSRNLIHIQFVSFWTLDNINAYWKAFFF